MGMRFVTAAEAIAADGLRMMVVGGIPSPWGEAAKGIFHVKRLDWLAVRLDYRDEALARWAGGQSAPVVVFDGEAPRAGWAAILLLAERLAPAPALVPGDAARRAEMFGLAHEILGEQGLAWERRLQMVHVGLAGQGGFAPKVAGYLAKKYGYLPERGASHAGRVAALLAMLAARLQAQQVAGSRYLVGDSLSAADVYCATAMALFRPLPEDVCAMQPASRATFETRDPLTDAALDPILLAHRDRIYADHLELPLTL